MCGKEAWDNVEENNARAEMGEKLRPDYSCKDKECGWVKWRPKDGSKEIIVETNHDKVFTGTKKTAVPPPNGYAESKKENTQTLARVDLMTTLIEVFGETNAIEDIKQMADSYWGWIIK